MLSPSPPSLPRWSILALRRLARCADAGGQRPRCYWSRWPRDICWQTLLTGFVHWFCDTFFDETTPLVGPGLIAPFREHHRDPLLMTRHGFLELTGSSFRGLGARCWRCSCGWSDSLTGLGERVRPRAGQRSGGDQSAAPLGARSVASGSWRGSLQRIGLVLTPARHARHHEPPYAAAYCVTSGWLNPLCERLKHLDASRSGVQRGWVALNRADRPLKRPDRLRQQVRGHRVALDAVTLRPLPGGLVRRSEQPIDPRQVHREVLVDRGAVPGRDASDGSAASRCTARGGRRSKRTFA